MQLSRKKKVVLGIQHVLAMFGATVLVPFLTGLNPSVALLTAGLGTLVFHLCTKGIVPVFIGSSFAFITAITLVLKEFGLADVKGGIIVAGLVYVLMAGVVKLVGIKTVESFFPPVVVGPVIMVIGLRMSQIALSMAGYNNGSFDTKSLIVVLVVLTTVIVVSMLEKSFFRLVPILLAVITGYITSMFFGMVDFEKIGDAKWLGFSSDAITSITTIPHFSTTAIIAIAPIALVVFIEHIGDISTNGAVVGKNFFENPGVSRTLLGDGLASIIAGLLGGPVNTTYGENTGVLAVTKVYDPSVLRIAAVFAILLSFIGKFGVIIQTIPTPVMGGISIVLFGMIASVGVRTLINANLNFTHSRNLIIASLIFVLGIAIDNVTITENLSISGLAISAAVGVVLNKILPEDR